MAGSTFERQHSIHLQLRMHAVTYALWKWRQKDKTVEVIIGRLHRGFQISLG